MLRGRQLSGNAGFDLLPFFNGSSDITYYSDVGIGFQLFSVVTRSTVYDRILIDYDIDRIMGIIDQNRIYLHYLIFFMIYRF